MYNIQVNNECKKRNISNKGTKADRIKRIVEIDCTRALVL